ncbi:ankyrin repeat protein [Plakobranchus ocellatus]|uniref:Ankyrin repeat protein n=1 Tax=Plakobranchus ocellatus TaxID=259542 RepID=A0AAV3YVS5_9GAST|nr:ankyrin repeat protein [Plakobranchus ocellatus]
MFFRGLGRKTQSRRQSQSFSSVASGLYHANTMPVREEVDARDSRGRTPLHLAVIGEEEYMVTVMLNLNAKTDIMDSANMMPIHYAASTGYLAILEVQNTLLI